MGKENFFPKLMGSAGGPRACMRNRRRHRWTGSHAAARRIAAHRGANEWIRATRRQHTNTASREVVATIRIVEQFSRCEAGSGKICLDFVAAGKK